jgi:rhodanese-related sulfurtransferase
MPWRSVNVERLCCNPVAIRASWNPTLDREVGVRGWVKVLLIMILLTILLGGVVWFVAGRPLAFEVLQRRTAARFPEVKWIRTEELARWQEDTGQAQPLILDARAEPEFAVSHLRGAVVIDPYRPSLRSLQGAPRDTAIVVYSSAGYRGARVAGWLRRAGYTTVVNLAGGIFKWANEDRPIFREQSRPTAMVHPYDQRWGLLIEGRYRAQAPEVEKRAAAP